jgi:hypothetical protein
LFGVVAVGDGCGVEESVGDGDGVAEGCTAGSYTILRADCHVSELSVTVKTTLTVRLSDPKSGMKNVPWYTPPSGSLPLARRYFETDNRKEPPGGKHEALHGTESPD